MPTNARKVLTTAALAVVLFAVAACGGARDIREDELAVLQNEWWDWVMSTPVDRHPVTDTTGQFCAEAQPDDIWFLAGTFGESADVVSRTCAIPAERPIFLPAVNILSAGVVFPSGPGAPVQGCLDVKGQMSGTVTLDGEPLVLEREDGSQVNVKGVMGNPLTNDLSTISGAGCGLWARIEPLSPGAHTLSIRGEAPGFATAVDYSLTVAE